MIDTAHDMLASAADGYCHAFVSRGLPALREEPGRYRVNGKLYTTSGLVALVQATAERMQSAIPCLRCGTPFHSADRKTNRICDSCSKKRIPLSFAEPGAGSCGGAAHTSGSRPA